MLVEEARPAHRVARWVVGGTCILADAAAAKAENLATAEATLWVPVAVAMAAVEGLPAVAVAAARLRKVASAAVVAVETAGAAQDFAVDLAVWVAAAATPASAAAVSVAAATLAAVMAAVATSRPSLRQRPS